MLLTLPPYSFPELFCERYLHRVCLEVVDMNVEAASVIVGYTICEVVVALAQNVCWGVFVGFPILVEFVRERGSALIALEGRWELVQTWIHFLISAVIDAGRHQGRDA